MSSSSERRAQRIVAEVFGSASDASDAADASTEPDVAVVPDRIARRARAVVDAVFDPPPPAPPPDPPPPTETQLAARRIVAEAEAAAVARHEVEERAQAQAEQGRREAEERTREQAELRAREAEERTREQAELRAREQARRAAVEPGRPPVDELPRTATVLAHDADPEAERLFPSAGPPRPTLFAGEPSAAEPVAPPPLPPSPAEPEAPPPLPPSSAEPVAPPPLPPSSAEPDRPPIPTTDHGDDADPAAVAARLAVEAIEHRDQAHSRRSHDEVEDDHTALVEPSAARRAGRWVIVTLLAAVALAWLLPVTIAALLELVSLS